MLAGSLKNKTALVSGGSRGIGAAIARELAECGANIAILDLSSPAEGFLEELEQMGIKAAAYLGDVSDFSQTEVIAAQIAQDFSGIDILVNNAGLTRDNLILRMSEADFDLVINVCLKGAFNLIKNALPLMVKKRWGRIINIASIAGLVGNAGQANYAAAKAGLIGLTKTVAKEIATRNITCNAIAPGFIQTEMTAALNETAQAKLLAQIPARRPGQAAEVAKLVAFLASEDAAYITGEVIRIDGGLV